MHVSLQRCRNTHFLKCEVTALQLHDTHRGRWWITAGACWASLYFWPYYENKCIAGVPSFISGPCSFHDIQLGRNIFSTFNMKEKSLSVLSHLHSLFSAPSCCCCKIHLLFWRSQMRDGTQNTMGIRPHSPIIPIPHPLSLSTVVKLTLCHPAMVVPTPYQQSGRWDIPVQAKDNDKCWFTVIPKPGPSPSSCVIRQLT